MTRLEITLAIVAAILLAATIYFGTATVRTVDGNVEIPTKTNFVVVEPKDAANGTLHLHTTKPIPAGNDLYVDVLHDGLSERPAQRTARTSAGLEATYTRNRALVEPIAGFPFGDWGTFAAVRTGPSAPGIEDTSAGTDSGRFVVGLRTSPVRLLYGTVAPDLLLAPHDLGLGLSAYAPPDLWGGTFDHWGIGVGRLYSLARGGSASTIAYLSFSTWDH
jgi:hypothetical protein